MTSNPQLASPAAFESSAPSIGTRQGTSYIWLAYSLFFIVDPILAHSRRLWIECGIIYVVFLAIYIAYVNARSRSMRFALLGGLYVLALISFPINSGASSFFIYIAAFLPFLVESVAVITVLLVVQSFGLIAEGLYVHSNRINMAATVLFIAVMGVTNVFIAQHKRSESRLRLANEEIEQLAALAERERIARDLHDVLGHTLSVIVLKAELAGRLIERDPIRAAQELADVERTARTALAEVREAIGGYRAKGLPAELELARNTLASAGVALSCESIIPRLNATEETVLALAVREAVTNIVRHARARHCRMTFQTTPDGFHSLQVEDDGTGLQHGDPHHDGHGLRGMRERISSLGGRLFITSAAPQTGTRLTIELPVAASTLVTTQACRPA